MPKGVGYKGERGISTNATPRKKKKTKKKK